MTMYKLRVAVSLGLVGLMFVAFGVRSVFDGGGMRDASESLTIGAALLALDAVFWRGYLRRRQLR